MSNGITTNGSVPVAIVQPGLSSANTGVYSDIGGKTTASAIAPLNFLQCASQSLKLANSEVLNYAPAFPSAFKTRAYGATTSIGGVIPMQNIPTMDPAYKLAGESGFVTPVASQAGTAAGLADFGTRFRAIFTNIPTGVNIYVTTSNLSGGSLVGNTTSTYTLSNITAPFGTTIALLVAGEQTPEYSVLPATTTLGNGTVGVYQLTPNANGTAEAVWELYEEATPGVPGALNFGVFYSYTANTTVSPAMPAAGTASVLMAFAPAPTPAAATGLPATFTAAAASVPSVVGGLPIPRFADTSMTFSSLILTPCQTVLLYPFVTNEAGFETGIQVANTTNMTIGTKATFTPQVGSCTLTFFGDSAPAAYTLTFPATPTTTSSASSAAVTLSGATAGTPFQGYVIANCNFQGAHGVSFWTDTSAQRGYGVAEALVVNNGTISRPNAPASEVLSH